MIATVYIHIKLVNFLIYKNHLLKFTRNKSQRKSGLMTSISFLELGCTWLFLGPRICMIITLSWVRLDLSPSWGVYHIFQIIEWIIVVWIILLNLVSAFLQGFWLGCCWSKKRKNIWFSCSCCRSNRFSGQWTNPGNYHLKPCPPTYNPVPLLITLSPYL